MNMLKKSFFVLLLISLCAMPLFAQNGEISGVIVKGGVTPLNIALEIPDAGLAAIIGNDLRLTGWFTLLQPASRPAAPAEANGRALNQWLTEWRSLGADQVLLVTVRSPDPLTLDYFVYDAKQGQLAAGKSYTGAVKDRRWLAHTISDDVLRTLWGTEGIARTHLLSVQQVGRAREIYWMDYDGAAASGVTANGAINLRPASVDGKFIAYISYSRIFPEIRAIQNGKTRTLYTQNDGLVSSPAFSADGRMIYFTASQQGNPDVYSLSASASAGTAPVQLTKSRAIDTEPSPSPDGQTVAFVSDRSGRPLIYLMDADGGNVRPLGAGPAKQTSPAYSPDGKSLLFTGSTGGAYEIYLYTFEDKSVKAITAGLGAEEPAFAPDSRHFVFVSRRSGSPQLYLSAIDGTVPPEPITKGAGNYLPVFVK